MGTMTDDCNEHVHCANCEAPSKLYATEAELVVGVRGDGWAAHLDDKPYLSGEFYCPQCRLCKMRLVLLAKSHPPPPDWWKETQ